MSKYNCKTDTISVNKKRGFFCDTSEKTLPLGRRKCLFINIWSQFTGLKDFPSVETNPIETRALSSHRLASAPWDALKANGAPADAVQVIGEPLTMEATDELLKHRDVGLILATGGPAMVKAAYSSGNNTQWLSIADIQRLLKTDIDHHE